MLPFLTTPLGRTGDTVPHITCPPAQEAGSSWEIGTETGDPLRPEVFAEEVLGSDDPTSAAVGP